ncbi:MAG: histidine kinase [Ginsengibacter sp.]
METISIKLRKKAVQILLHLLFWMIIVTYFAWGFGFGVNYKAAFLNASFFLPGFILIVYSLVYFLIPRYLIHKKYVQFFAGLIFVLAICSAYSWLLQLKLSANSSFAGYTMTTGRTILPFIHVAGIAISINLLNYWYQQKQKTVEAQNERMAAELDLLKSQIHPHFLFNTLNNLYSYTLENSEKAPEIILKLSNLLRFMIYESNVAYIPLEKEISLLQQYIELEQLRYSDRLDISFTINGDLNGKQIAPLLLLPFLENAFKHGISHQLDQCWISFDLRLSGPFLYFKLINSKDKDETSGFTEASGLGLQNVKRRLALLYPGNYKLETLEKEEIFIVNLELQIEEINDAEKMKDAKLKKINQKYDLEMLNS